MPHLDATPENTNAWSCPVCGADPGLPCFYSTSPPIVRDRMHLGRARLDHTDPTDQPGGMTDE